MITVLIGGPQAIGKTQLADALIELLKLKSTKFQVYTTNGEVRIPEGAVLEGRSSE